MSDEENTTIEREEPDEQEDAVIEFQQKIRITKDVHEKFDIITKALFKFDVCGKSGEQGCPFFPDYNQLELLHDEFDYDLNNEEEEASTPQLAREKYKENATLLEEWWVKYHHFMEKANLTWKVLKQIKAQKNAEWKVINQKHDWLMEIFDKTASQGHVDASVFSAMGSEFKDMFKDLYTDNDILDAEQAKQNAIAKLRKERLEQLEREGENKQ